MQSKRRFFDIQEQRKAFLDIRRKKLANMLRLEEDQYKLEIIANQETPEQVRAKMESKLKVLKEEREQERLQQVQKLQEKKFYAGADELRKNDSEAFAVECYLEQENQMLDKLRKREVERKQEEVYVKLNELDMKKKLEIEKHQQEELKKKKVETYKLLQWQAERQAEDLAKEKKLKQLEAERIKAQWHNDNLREQEEKENMKRNNVIVYKDLQEFNKQEEEIKRKKIEIEKKKDKMLIDSIVNKEKALDEIDKAEKEKKKSEFFQNKKYLEYVMNQKKEADAWMDHLAQQEADKQWRKEQEAWLKRENARIELLKKVYKEREEALLWKREAETNEKVNLKNERKAIDDAVLEYNKKLEEIQLEDAKKRKAHQDDLLYQIREKDRMRQKELQDKMYEERAAKLWEIEYQKKIDQQRQLHIQRLANIKRRGMEDNLS